MTLHKCVLTLWYTNWFCVCCNLSLFLSIVPLRLVSYPAVLWQVLGFKKCTCVCVHMLRGQAFSLRGLLFGSWATTENPGYVPLHSHHTNTSCCFCSWMRMTTQTLQLHQMFKSSLRIWCASSIQEAWPASQNDTLSVFLDDSLNCQCFVCVTCRRTT